MATEEFEEYQNLLADERTTQYELLKEELTCISGVIVTRDRRRKPEALHFDIKPLDGVSYVTGGC